MRMFVVLAVLFSLIVGQTNAQELAGSLTIGKRIPNVRFDTILNYGSFHSSLNEFKGKVVILDFWSRGCGSCIASFPKIEKLNRIYEGKAIVIPVSRETYSEFKKIKSQILREVKLPFVVGDTMLHHYFPHKFVPHCIWVNEAGEFIGTTISVTSQMIDEALSGKKLIAQELDTVKKNQPLESFEEMKSRLTERKLDGYTYYSSVKKMDPLEVSSRDIRRFPEVKYIADTVTKKLIGVRAKANLMDIISMAYKMKISDMVFVSTELEKMIPPKGNASLAKWSENNMFIYEYIEDPAFVDSTRNLFGDLNKNDINDVFGIVGEYKEVIRRCYVLTKVRKDTTKINDVTDDAAFERTGNGIYIKNYYTNMLIGILSQGLNSHRARDYPVLDETGLMKVREMYLRIEDEADIVQWNRELNRYGYNVELVERQMKTLYLKIENNTAFSMLKF